MSISERPKEVDGVRFGDFEMDTIVGKGNCGAIVTLVEKQTNSEKKDITIKYYPPF